MEGSKTPDKGAIVEALIAVVSARVLVPSRRNASQATTFEEVTEAAEYLADEIEAHGVHLPSPVTGGGDEKDTQGQIEAALTQILGGEPTLENLEAHPLYPLVLTTLEEVFLVSPTQKAARIASDITEDTIRSLLCPLQSSEDGTATKAPRHKKGTLGECELCERSMPLTEHHLIPRTEHHRLATQGVFALAEMRSRLAMLCRPCHSAVHSMITTEDLAASFNTMDALLQHEGICKWGNYASKLKERRAGYEGFGLKSKR